MVKLWYALRGYTVMEICGASPGWALNRLTQAKIAFWDVIWLDALTLRLKVFRGKEKKTAALAQQAMCECRTVERGGLIQSLHGLRFRPVLLTMLLLDLLCVLVLPCFLFFFSVEGNETVPEQLILRELEAAGVNFGTYGPSIYPRSVKDHMIHALPRLQWVTVFQHGCRATVVVREREEIPQTQTKKGLANVVATQGGVITQQAVFVGQAQYQVGDTVAKGDVLVSGVVDLERTYLLERAHAEIFARTWREICVCTPSNYREKQDYGRPNRCIWLILGDRRIKIFGNSGISYDSCDKMINTKTMTLPQGLQLPLSLEMETFYPYSPAEKELGKEAAEVLLAEYALADAKGRMQAGEILDHRHKIEKKGGLYRMEAVLECHEMIARTVEAKWNNEDFVND